MPNEPELRVPKSTNSPHHICAGNEIFSTFCTFDTGMIFNHTRNKNTLSAGLRNYDHWEIAHRDCEKTESQIVSEKNPRKIVSSDHLFSVTGNSVFWNYKPKQNYKSKMLKKFSELLENAFETMKEGINI